MTEETANPPALRPLPVRPRPISGETPSCYLRRLARANHLRPRYLGRYLRAGGTGPIRLDMLAALAARPVSSLEHAFGTASSDRAHHEGAKQRQRLFTAIREDAGNNHRSIRALADQHGVHRRTIRQALAFTAPPPRKKQSRSSRLAPYRAAIDAILDNDPDHPGKPVRTCKQILDRLITEHNATGISLWMVRDYVADRSLRPRPAHWAAASPDQPSPAPWSPAHLAIQQHDLPRLRELLDAGHDVEDDNGHGWTLLRHAIHRESATQAPTGQPLHADMTAFLLARGADPRALHNNTSIEAEAELLGHWLAAEIIRAWTKPPAQHRETPQQPTSSRAACIETRTPTGRNQ